MTWFDCGYTPAERRRKGFSATRPDCLVEGTLRGRPAADISHLPRAKQRDARDAIEALLRTVRQARPAFLDLAEPMDTRWVDAFDRYYDKRRVVALTKAATPDERNNAFVARCSEFGAVLGTVLRERLTYLHWVYESPYWESAILDPESRAIVPVFHWSIKKFSDYGGDDGFGAKLRACAEFAGRRAAEAGPEGLAADWQQRPGPVRG